jgi:hypothetical protein
VLVGLRLGLTVALLVWAWREGTSAAVLTLLTLSALQAELGALVHRRLQQSLELVAHSVATLAQSTAGAYARLQERIAGLPTDAWWQPDVRPPAKH